VWSGFSWCRRRARQIVCYGFVNPLVAVARPRDDVAPPLMRNFVIRNQLGEVFLAGGGESCALLGFGRQEGIGGNVEQAGPALPEGSRNRRDVEVMEGKGTAECFRKNGSRNRFLCQVASRASAGLGEGVGGSTKRPVAAEPNRTGGRGMRRRLERTGASANLPRVPGQKVAHAGVQFAAADRKWCTGS